MNFRYRSNSITTNIMCSLARPIYSKVILIWWVFISWKEMWRTKGMDFSLWSIWHFHVFPDSWLYHRWLTEWESLPSITFIKHISNWSPYFHICCPTLVQILFTSCLDDCSNLLTNLPASMLLSYIVDSLHPRTTAMFLKHRSFPILLLFIAGIMEYFNSIPV